MSGVGRFDWRTIAVVVVVAVAVLVGMIVVSDDSESKKPHPSPTAHPHPTPSRLQFAVWGNKDEVAAFQAVVDDYNASSKDTSVSVVSWPDADAMLTDIRSGKAKPDLYLLPRSELAETVAEKRNHPLLDLLSEREVPIGDDFSRDAVSAFSFDDDLQCMPYTTSPMVIYYNKALVDFDKMKARDLPTPNPDHSGWSLDEFRAAAQFASRPRKKIRGVHIDATLEGLAPFIQSGGGRLYDDDTTPTSLALSSDDSTGAIRRTLELLRDPRLTLSTRQLKQRPALAWFKRGKLGMIAGYRDLTPVLRATPGLSFDVMPMPSLGKAATVGELTGVCLAANRSSRVTSSANFLTYLVSEEAVARVAQTGYIQPTNLQVALSPAFLQGTLAPENAAVFNNAVRSIRLPPLMEDGGQLEQLVDPDLQALLTTPDVGDLDETLAAIDEKSRLLLDPDYEPSESPSGSPSGAVSGSTSESASESASVDRD